jgi:hypothetical protein
VPESLATLLRQRDLLDSMVRDQFSPFWETVQEELGIAEALRSCTPPTLKLDGERIGFPIPVRVPASDFEAERRSATWISIPDTAIAEDLEHLRRVLRREFPLRCSRCGIVYPVGSQRCTSPATCWGTLRWRTVSPRPVFYVETEDNYGYFSPGPRRLRYAIDLSDYGVFGVQYTLRTRDKWLTPIPWVVRDVVYRLAHTVALDLGDALAGEASHYARAVCLAYEAPDWCARGSQCIPLPIHGESVRLRSA